MLLLACDDAEIGRKLAARLTAGGVPVELQTDPATLTSLARRSPPEAALLRWHAGNLAGILISRLRAWWPMPVLALVPNGDANAAIRALKAGAYDAISEPHFDIALAKETLSEGARIAAGGRERLGPYELHEMIGSGGMGVVHRARDLRDGREVALKILRPEQATFPDFVARFEREVGEAQRLTHPNLTAVYEGGRARGRLYISMELVRGRTLEQVLGDGGRLPIRRALQIALGIARGLSHAHQHGMVHRDIKPENLVIGSEDDVHIMDFGLLRKTDDLAQITARGEFVGTVRYASPEHMRGERVDARGDLYSLGVVMYEMLSGARPYEGKDTMRLARQVAYGSPFRPLKEACPEAPADAITMVHQMLSLRPEDRPGSAAIVMETIERLMA